MSTNCLDGFPQYSQYSTLLNTALPTSSSTAHLPALMLAAILDNAAPTIITNLAGDVLYANHTTLALLEHDDTSSMTASQRFSLPPPALKKSTSSLPYHYSKLLEPVDALNTESIRNHLTGLTTLDLFFQRQTTVSRNVKCLTAQTRRSIHLRLSTRILPTTAFDPSQPSPRKIASQVSSSPSPTSTSYSAAAADVRAQGPAPKHTHSTPIKHQNPTNTPTPILLLTTLTDLTDPSLIFARDNHRVLLAYNSKGVIVEASPMCLSILGYTLDELLGTWGYDHIHPDDVDQMRDSHARLLAPLAQDERQVFRMRRKNGKYAWLDLRSAGTQTEGAYVFVGFDVTAEKEKELEAQKMVIAKAREVEGDEVVGKRTEEHNKANKFVGFICHELRNPLNGIIGFNSLLLDTPQLSETQLEYAEAIAKISQHMCNLLNQTLDLCQTQQPYSPADSVGNSSSSDLSHDSPRPDSPRHPTTPRHNYRSLNLKEVVEFGFVTVSVAARAKQTELRFCDDITPMLIGLAHPEAGVIASTSHSVDPATLKVVTTGLRPCPVYGDEDSVRKIILNYLTNAIKYTPAGGNVTVHLSVDSPTLPPALAGTHRGFTARCAISDTGLGIPAKDLCRLFLPYSKLIHACGNEEITPQAAAAAGGSSGLGLSICKELADKIGGRVGVDSIMGHGSTFWVTFPVYYDLPEGCVMDEDELSKVCKCVSTCVAGTCKLWSSLAIKPTKQRKRPAKVLMVEDNSVNQRVAQKYLEKMGEEVTVASDGAAALERMRKEKFDILFVDLQMPVMDGYTFTRHVRAAEHEHTLAKVQAVLDPHRRSSTVSSSVLFGLPGTQLDSAHSSLSTSSSVSSSDSLFSPTHEQAAFIARRYSDFSLSPASTPASEPTTPSIITSHNHIGLILGERPVPIVACTGNVLERDRALCKELGMDGFLSKPYKMDDMRRCIDELVICDDEDMERGE